MHGLQICLGWENLKLEGIISKHTSSIAYQKHVSTSAAYYLQCNFDNSLSKIHIYRREDCIKWYVNQSKGIDKKVDSYQKNIVPMDSFAQKQMQEFGNAENCHI